MKKDPNQLVTRAILKEEMKEAFKQELKDVVRKDDLTLEIESKIAPLFYDMKKNMEEWKDEILNKEDKVIQLLVKHEQEQAAMHFNYTGLKERVVKLEDVVFPEVATG